MVGSIAMMRALGYLWISWTIFLAALRLWCMFAVAAFTEIKFLLASIVAVVSACELKQFNNAAGHF